MHTWTLFYTNSAYGFKFLTVLLCALGHFFTPTMYMGSNSLPYFYAHSDTFLHQQCIWVQIANRTFMHTWTLFYTNSVYGIKFLTVLLCTLRHFLHQQCTYMGSNSLPNFYAHSDTFLHQHCIWVKIPY